MDKEIGALRDFEKSLSQLGTALENKTRFYIYWVRRFLIAFVSAIRNSIAVVGVVPLDE